MYQVHYKIRLFCGGGCLWNPGEGAIGFIVFDEDWREIDRRYWRVGYTTNNRASYLALIEGLELVTRYTRDIVHCFLENELVVKQVKGWWAVNNSNLRLMWKRVVEKENAFQKVTYTIVKRTNPTVLEVENLINRALDGDENKGLNI